jgi:hypothetical protein
MPPALDRPYPGRPAAPYLGLAFPMTGEAADCGSETERKFLAARYEMETQAQSPPTPALHTRQGEGGGTRRREGGLWGERMGSPGAYPEGVRWSPARLRWRGPRPSASGTEERGASPLTPDSRRACHTCTPLGQRPGHTRGHTHRIWDLPPPSPTHTHHAGSVTHTHAAETLGSVAQDTCAHTHTQFLPAC